MVDWTKRVIADQGICHGKPCIKGTRIMVAVILDNLAEGMAPDEIVAQYPPLTDEDVRAAISYAAALARVDEPRQRRIAAVGADHDGGALLDDGAVAPARICRRQCRRR